MGKSSSAENKKLLKQFYEEATNSETSSDRLEYIWNTTTSVKIRKAVAANCNSSPELLRVAARLYLEEVLSNTSFELLSMFTTQDLWIKSISEAYESPDKFLTGKSMWTFRGNKLEAALRACLCSENLNRESLLLVLEYIPRLSLRRSIKNKVVRDKIRSLVLSKDCAENSFASQNIAPIVTLFLEEIIDEEEVTLLLNKYPAFQTYWKKSTIVSALSKTFKNYEKVQNADVFERQKSFALGFTIIKSKRGFTNHHLINPSIVWNKEKIDNPTHAWQRYTYNVDYVASANRELAYLKFILDMVNFSFALQNNNYRTASNHKFFNTNLRNRTDGVLIPQVKDRMIKFFASVLFKPIKDENVVKEMIINLYNFIKDNNYAGIINTSMLNTSFNTSYIDEINKLNLPQEVNKYFAQKFSI